MTIHTEVLRSSMQQPPPPPPETDPNQVYDERHMGIPRPQSIDPRVPVDRLDSDWFPSDPCVWGVGREEAISERYV